MTAVAIGFICVAAAIFLMLLRVPIGVALGAPSILGIYFAAGWRPLVATLSSAPYEFAASWELSAVPMFILMGSTAFATGMTDSLFQAARMWFGRLPGGLAIASNWACAGFSAASGSSLATTLTMGQIAIPVMRRYGYDPGLATGVVAAAGTLGSLIPPSILLVIYGIFAGVSIPKLFLAAIIPGLLTAGVYTATILMRCKLKPSLAPVPEETYTMGEKLRALAGVWPLPLIVVLVIGSMYAGIATATEAGAMGVFITAVIALVRRQMNLRVVKEAIIATLNASTSIFFVAIGAVLMTRLMAYTGVPNFLASSLGTNVSPATLLIATLVLYLVLGMFIDSIGMVLLTLPVLLPIFNAAGLDLIWFGILLVKFVEIGLITPPVGMNVFAVRSITPDLPVLTIFKGAGWFFLAELFVLVILMIFPSISLFLVQ
ncbi:TRAP transporter large permease subunit [Maritimibacter sp. DP07]|uniref:TRAP transporter large permease protein n=1 Tax=Maritimibacter harenae TaxID=2606218 RepID=A0A845LWF7_9RHOB|nr:TRAP transporter large permease subunit [Maritimibacter harenae]MZR11686.1 TRAP transporter large permease subunit [Maritimibacter harenae]